MKVSQSCVSFVTVFYIKRMKAIKSFISKHFWQCISSRARGRAYQHIYSGTFLLNNVTSLKSLRLRKLLDQSDFSDWALLGPSGSLRVLLGHSGSFLALVSLTGTYWELLGSSVKWT